MRLSIRSLCFALLLPIAAAFSQNIQLEGFVPQGITAPMASYEYKRIHSALSLDKKRSRAPITITYFTKHGIRPTYYSLPEWGGGGAIGRDQIIVALDAKPFLYADFAQITVHELVHIAINRICTTTVVPRWFHEGVAMALSGDITFQEQVVLSRAILTGSLISLSSIDSVNSFGRYRAQLAYAQSHQAVKFLINMYGIEALQEILHEANKSASFSKGVTETLQLSQHEIESYARAYLARTFRLAFFVADTYLIWVIALILFIAGYIATRIRNRKKLALMEAQEAEAAAAQEQSAENVP